MPSIARTCAAAAVAALTTLAAGQCPISLHDSVLHPAGPAFYAPDVSTDGDHLVLGQTSSTDVYRRLGGGWELVQQLQDEVAVAVEGQWLVRGSSRQNGRVFIYRLIAGEWTLWQEIRNPVVGETFGAPLALDGNRLLVGRTQPRIYEFDGATEQWALQATLPHAAVRLALRGNLAAVSDYFANDVQVYERDADGVWSPVVLPFPTLTPSLFGYALAFDGGSLLVSDPGVDEQRGAVYVYNRSGGEYQLTATISPASLPSAMRFGSGLGVSHGVLVVTSLPATSRPGPYVYPFVRSADGWTQVEPITLSVGHAARDVVLSAGHLVIPDWSGIAHFSAGISDFDGNGVLDRCDVAAGTYPDLDCDNTPDVSPLDRAPASDCDGDGQPDACRSYDDCDTNRIPDSCQFALGLSDDCNGNGRPDWCDIHSASSNDCNGNGVPDECDIASGVSLDCNADQLPDECDEDDCNGNGVPDDCDVAAGTSIDCNDNARPDECECSMRSGCILLTFVDVTAAAGLAGVTNREGLVNHFGGAGGVTGDFNNDGWQDIYFVAGENPDQLYINNGDGTFRNETIAWGVLPGLTQGAAMADYDGDGWLDLLVSGAQRPCRLYRNNAGTGFTDVAAAAGLSINQDIMSASWGDYDLDGDLDLFITDFQSSNTLYSNQNTLYRNNGNGTFTDATAAAGLDGTAREHGGSGVRLFDLDGDRLPELLLLSHSGENRYYAGRGSGLFQERPDPFEAVSIQHGTGIAIGDFDEDGAFDLGIASNRAPMPTVLRNEGGHAYTRNTLPWHAPAPMWQMAAAAVDIDHDTRPDLVITTKLDGQFLYHNTGVPNGLIEFTDVSQCTNFISGVSGRGVAIFDFDNDGDRDVILFPKEGVQSPRAPGLPTLLRNDLAGPETNWIRIFLDTSAAADIPPNGIGSVVKVRLGEGSAARTLMNFIDGGSNYLSQNELSAHFGLAGATMIDEIIVEWTNGTTTTLSDVPANQTLTIAAPPCAADIDANAVINVFDLLAFLDGWFAGDGDFDDNGATDLLDLVAFIDAWFEGC